MGDEIQLLKALKPHQLLMCFLGRRKFVYVPGRFADTALEGLS